MMKVIAALALTLTCGLASAVDEESKAGIITHCKTTMGEYGPSMVKACVNQEFEAWAEVESAKNESPEATIHCNETMGEYGLAMVSACIKQEVEATENFNSIPAEYQEIADRCLTTMGEYGYSMVYSCSIQDIEAQKELDKL